MQTLRTPCEVIEALAPAACRMIEQRPLLTFQEVPQRY